jgi:hypothetical protein
MNLTTLMEDKRRRNLAILAVIAVVSVTLAAAALWAQAARLSNGHVEETFFPSLPSHVRDIERIHIASKKGTFDVAFKPDSGWVLPGRDNFPASFEEVRKTVVGIAALQTIEPKTARPDWLHYLGLDAPPKGDGVEISLLDDKGNMIAALIAGKTTDIGDPSGATGLFVRKLDSNQAWLARSVFTPDSDPGQWMNHDVIGVDRSRIQETRVEPANGPAYTVRRDKPSDASFTLVELPKGRELSYDSAPDGVAAAIVGFTFDDAKPAKDFDFTNSTTLITRTFDGLAVTVEAIQQGQDYWAELSAEAAPGARPEIAKEAREIDAHASGWAYKLPGYKGQQFMTSLDSLLKPVDTGAAKKK